MAYKDPDGRKKYYNEHKEEINRKAREKYASSPEKREDTRKRNKKRLENEDPRIIKSRSLKHYYGITIEDYDRMFEEQEGLCAICELPETRIIRNKVASLHVDHNHETGEVRGLLCSRCNVAIGMMKENPSLFVKAAEYLNNGTFSRLREIGQYIA